MDMNMKNKKAILLDLLDFADSIKNKKIEFNLKNFKKLIDIYSDSDYNEIDTQYKETLICTFIDYFDFNSYNSYVSFLKLLTHGKYFEYTTIYAQYAEKITNSFLNSKKLKFDWMIKHMAFDGSYFEINNTIRFICKLTTNNDDIKLLNSIVNSVDGTQNEILIYEAVVRNAIYKRKIEFAEILNKIFNKTTKISINGIESLYDTIEIDEIRAVINEYLFKRTKKIEYLPQEAIDILIF